MSSSRSSSALSLTTSEWLTLAVVQAAREAHTATGELHEAVCAYVRELKDRGYPPERVLVAAKALLTESGLRKSGPLADRGSSTPSPETEIVDRVVAWCIEEYFLEARDAG